MSKLEQVLSTEKKDLSRNGHYGKFYHIPESVTKCPRCGDISSLIEDSPSRCLYECRNCGIFSKIKPKKQRPDGLRCAIAQGELTTALEILERTGHRDQDAIAALNRYRGDTDGIAGTDSQDDQKGGHGNAGDDSQRNQKTTAIITRCGFVLFEN